MSGIFFFIFPLAFSPPHPKLTSERDEILGMKIYDNGKKGEIILTGVTERRLRRRSGG